VYGLAVSNKKKPHPATMVGWVVVEFSCESCLICRWKERKEKKIATSRKVLDNFSEALSIYCQDFRDFRPQTSNETTSYQHHINIAIICSNQTTDRLSLIANTSLEFHIH